MENTTTGEISVHREAMANIASAFLLYKWEPTLHLRERIRHWFMTEYSGTNAWNLNFSNGNVNRNNNKVTNQNRVRPVSAPIK
jgi:hypothetical protein